MISFKKPDGTAKPTRKPENGPDTPVTEISKVEDIIAADQSGRSSDQQRVLELKR